MPHRPPPELATTHRFHHPWEQQASLLLRAGNPEALDAYFAHRRIEAGTFDDLAADAARRWVDHTDRGQSVALVAETNEHVDALNAAVQAQRRRLGHLDDRIVRVAGDETASVGDLVVTRRNDRTLRTDRPRCRQRRARARPLQEQHAVLADAPRWRRGGITAQLQPASDVLDAARSKMNALELLAAPHTARVDAAEKALHQAEHDASAGRIRGHAETTWALR